MFVPLRPSLREHAARSPRLSTHPPPPPPPHGTEVKNITRDGDNSLRIPSVDDLFRSRSCLAFL
jgi:hypothetical protein